MFSLINWLWYDWNWAIVLGACLFFGAVLERGQ